MDGDAIKKVNAGASPAVLLDAARFNLLSDVGNWFRTHAGGQIGLGAIAPQTSPFPRLEVWVRSSVTLPERSIVKPSGAMTEINPQSVPVVAMSEPAFDVVAPTSESDQVYITTQAVPGTGGFSRRAIAMGVAVADVEHVDAGHQFAQPIPGNTARLRSSPTGQIRILPEVPPGGGASIRTRHVLLTGQAGAATGFSWKQPVRVATTAAGTLASSFENGDTVDGEVLATGDRILIKNQASGAENGIYTVNASGAPTRATDADTGPELVGAAVVVTEGTTNQDTVWLCTTDAPITVGATALSWAKLGTGITVKEVDGSPVVSPTLEMRFNQGNGFIVTSPGAGIAQVDLFAASPTQIGVVTITSQQFGGHKSFDSAGSVVYYVHQIAHEGSFFTGLNFAGFEGSGVFGSGPQLFFSDAPSNTNGTFKLMRVTSSLSQPPANGEFLAVIGTGAGTLAASPAPRFAVARKGFGESTGIAVGVYAAIPGVGTFSGGILTIASGGQVINGGSF